MGDASHKRKGEDKTCKTTKKKWTPKEDAALIAALSELCNAGWKRETGIFKNGYTSALERKLKSKLPGCNIKASPHIESRLKLLKRQYDAITEMQGAAGMQWDDKDNLLICEDDDVWEEWVQTHTDAKGLRNKQFPYYNDLHVLFGNRGTRKGVNNELDSDKVFVDNDNNATTLMVDDIEEDDRVNYEAFQNGSFDKEVDPRAQNNIVTISGADSLIQHYKKRKTQRDIIKNISNSIMLPDHERASDRSDDSTGTNRSDDENLSADATTRTKTQPCHSTINVLNKKSCKSESGSSELGQLAKIFGTFLEKYQEHLSLLGEIIGRETAAEKIAGEKRANLNGELTKLPNLNLQARLRAASLIVSDPAKLDLFYSLSKEERREWVSMLLSGLI
ncbi:hypothetical protein DH2020_003656 [Rehmannia glutinosa]|uniref:Myb/SANT-like domain-containing protein n=1 Tax=Rehmannia glutinosa TaxID=99300 RepID=A0ABR0XM90_REHGL